MNEGLKLKIEGFEDGYKTPKVFMLNAIAKEQKMEQVGEVKSHKGREEEPAGCGNILSSLCCFEETLPAATGCYLKYYDLSTGIWVFYSLLTF